MSRYFKIYLNIFFVLFLSCDKDGTIIVNPPIQETPFINDLLGNSCSDDYTCYAIDDIYYDFSSNNAFEVDYYKFNALQLASGNHDANDPSNILTLKSFNDNYFIGIPAASISNQTNQVLVIDDTGENYQFDTQDIISLNLDSEDTENQSGELTASSNPFSVVRNITWNSNQGRYNFTTESADTYSSSFLYDYQYKDKNWSTLVDTVLNVIYGDIILVDQEQDTTRTFTIIDSLDNADEVRSTRKIKYKVNSTYISDDDALMFKQSTDCNDNYRQDGPELKMSDIESMCVESGGSWFENLDSSCDSYCSNNGVDVSFDTMCWNNYTSDSRLSARCFDAMDEEAFCDRGNNLYDTAEYYLEENEPPNGLWGVNDNQNIEPFEDRNCNNTRDVDESLNTAEDCFGFISSDGDLDFCDRGNEIWDDQESCYGGLCSSIYDYKNLYKRSDAPDRLVVTYHDQSHPIAFEEILPKGKFFDSGSDGCFDIFEDGEGSCICELNDFNDDIPSCEDFLTSLGLMTEVDGYFIGDLNKDGEITEIDISAADFSNYNYGQCLNGFSGREEDCCLSYNCNWDDDSDTCDFSDCEIEDNSYWSVLLDPNGDNYSESNLAGSEYNGNFDAGEQARTYVDESLADDDSNKLIDYNEYYSNELNYSLSYIPFVKSPDYIVTKQLSYSDGFENGGDQIQIILDSYEIQDITVYESIVESINTVTSNAVIDQLDLSDQELESLSSIDISGMEDFYSSILNNYHLVKTEFTNSSGNLDYDYFIFKDSESDIVKMVHPYYHFLPGYSYPQDISDFSDEDFWQAVHLEPDTLLYSSNGNIAEGQSFQYMSHVFSDTANYNILKQYTVEKATASLKHNVLDPNCVLLSNDLCGNEDFYWCAWNAGEDSCYSLEVSAIPNCLLVDRTIETTAIGPGMSYKLRSETYFKPGFGIVREDVSIYWDNLPWIDVPWIPVSSIQYKTPSSELFVNNSWNLFNSNRVELDEFDNIEEFDYQPYRINSSMGLQRVEMP